MSPRRTPEQIAEARAYFERDTVRQFAAVALRDALGTIGLGHFKTLLAATEPPPVCSNPDCESGLVYEGECSKCYNPIPHDCPECNPVKP